jgi:hypothetical protein
LLARDPTEIQDGLLGATQALVETLYEISMSGEIGLAFKRVKQVEIKSCFVPERSS